MQRQQKDRSGSRRDQPQSPHSRTFWSPFCSSCPSARFASHGWGSTGRPSRRNSKYSAPPGFRSALGTAEGGGGIALPDGARLVERAYASDALLARTASAPLRVCSGVTVFAVTTRDETAARLARAYDADVEAMEGFAVLRACERAGVPGIEVRGVANYVGDRARSGWDFAAGARACVVALDAVLDALSVAA